MRRPRRRAPAWAITALVGIVYVIAAPSSADLAAASYRSYLFGQAGFALWDNGWYGGHALPAYSLLAPALGWLLGPRLVAALALTAATALFEALIEGLFAPRATRVAAVWFAIGASLALLATRVPFDLGLAIGLGALLAARRGRRAAALALAVVCACASPVAGAFLALAALSWALALRPGAFALWLAGASLLPLALLALAFPEGGTQPFVASAFYPALLGVVLIAVLIPAERAARAPRGPDPSGGRSVDAPTAPAAQKSDGGQASARARRALRVGAWLYAAALVGAYVVHSPVGGNVDRLGSLAAGPIAACALLGAGAAHRAARGRGFWRGAGWRARVLLVIAPFLLYWQANAPVTDFAAALSDPAVHASYYAPLLAELRALGVGYDGRPARVEVVPTVDHWEARFVAAHVAIARGWERQLDTERNAIFYSGGPLSPARYHSWLARRGISYVALPDAPLDYSAKREARLLGAPPSYLHELWRSAHWRLFAVREPVPLAQPPAVLTQLGSESFTLRAPRAGTFTVRVQFSPYWSLARGRGCVRRTREDWTQLATPGAETVHVVVAFALARVFDHGARCRPAARANLVD